MHDRISVHAVCFPGANFRELSAHWQELGARRVTLVSHLLLDEGLQAAQEALEASQCRVESITHPFLPGRHLEQREESWSAARDALTRVIEAAEEHWCPFNLHAVRRSRHADLGRRGGAFREAIAPCVIQAREAGVELLVENSAALYADVHIAHTLRDTLTLAELADVRCVHRSLRLLDRSRAT